MNGSGFEEEEADEGECGEDFDREEMVDDRGEHEEE